ncbi:integrase [Spinactinospora alkalitolerans]|uniref:Integrase n=1 Tax=Spinactinospora alkalitolerans TaxID=687207 RepID=A0A852U6B5_9ACTN|nr:site-specific integrase [Spinactinospora alkalitolerans]NYE49614.1 integrase [Spinactinospora alkalitolerans]
MAQRARRGDDSIYWDKSKNCFVGEASMGYTPSGKRRRPKVYGKTKTEVRNKLRDKRQELENGVKSSARYTVADAGRDWLKNGLKGRDPGTVKLYAHYVETCIIPGLGKRVLRDLTADDVDDWLDTLTERYATSVIARLLGMLRRIIRQAQRRDKLLRNVAELVEAPAGTEGRPSKALNLDQARAVLAAAAGSLIHAYIVVSLLTGMRTEEARALRWEHVHLDPGEDSPPYIEVWRSVRRKGETKTRKSRRTLALPPLAVRVLKEHQEEQDRQQFRAGDRWKDADLVFSTRNGTERDAQDVNRMFKRVTEKAGIGRDWSPRELRHSFVSLLSSLEVPIEQIKDLVGHHRSSTTETVYRKELRPVLRRGAEVLGPLLEEEEGENG